MLFEFMCSHQPAHTAKVSFPLPPCETAAAPQNQTPTRAGQAKQRSGEKPLATEGISREKDCQGGASAHLTFLQNSHCKHQSTAGRVAEGAAALGCMPDPRSPQDIPNKPRLADIPIMPLLKHPPAVQGTQVIWGTPQRPFSPWQ